jgi:hypothetical protein
MDIWSADKLVLFMAFVVPGFVSLKAYELLSLAAPKDASNQIVDAVAYSSFNYALLLWPIYEIETRGLRESHPTWYILFYVFVLLIAPLAWAAALWKLRFTQFFQRTLPHPTGKAWDYVFRQRKASWVIVTMKDGKQIAGRYDSKSFASSAPETHQQLYLEQAWKLSTEGGFERPRVESAGILVLSSDIASVEFFNIVSGDVDEQAEGSGTEGLAAEGSSGARVPAAAGSKTQAV